MSTAKPAQPEAAPSLKLVGITFYETPIVPGLRAGAWSSLKCDEPVGSLMGWRIVVQGQIVVFVSPPGWAPANASYPHLRDPKGPMRIFELPKSTMCLEWSGDESAIEAIRKGGKYETMPLGWKPAPVVDDKPILAQIPSQLGDA